MVNFNNIWAVARMERRHTRRLARYWVFLAIAYLFGIGGYVYYSVLHAFFSSLSASVGMIGPRYLMGAIALYYLTGFVLGIVFLGFDVRARDIREGIVEVLDARPLTNFELVTGRFVALFLSAWIPIVVLVLLIQGLGFLLPLLGSPVGSTVEPLSLVNFAVFMAVPGLVFAIGLVFVITLLVRHRLIAALLAIAAIVGLYWAYVHGAGYRRRVFRFPRHRSGDVSLGLRAGTPGAGRLVASRRLSRDRSRFGRHRSRHPSAARCAQVVGSRRGLGRARRRRFRGGRVRRADALVRGGARGAMASARTRRASPSPWPTSFRSRARCRSTPAATSRRISSSSCKRRRSRA